MSRILAFSGSARKESYNTRLLAVAASGAAAAGAEVTSVDLGSFEIPLFNQDYEEQQGFPPGALRFKRLLQEHDGLLIASPEYNGMLTPLLKNVLDWASRAETEDEPIYAAYTGKIAAIMSASLRYSGGRQGLGGLRQLLSDMGVMVIPDQVNIPRAESAFNPDGTLKKESRQTRAVELGKTLAEMLRRLHT